MGKINTSIFSHPPEAQSVQLLSLQFAELPLDGAARLLL